MAYFTNYDVVNNKGNKVEKRYQPCFSSLVVNSNDVQVDVWIPTKGQVPHVEYCRLVPFEEIERFVILFTKAGFDLTLDPEIKKFYETVEGYKISFPIKTTTHKKEFALFYGTYIRYLYELDGTSKGYHDSYIPALYKLEKNLPFLDYGLLPTLAEYCHDHNTGNGHSGVSMKIKMNIYKIPTIEERVAYIINNNSAVPIHQSSVIKDQIDIKGKSYCNDSIINLLNKNEFDKILEIFDLKAMYELKKEIISKEKLVTEKKNLRSRTIKRVC